MFIGLDTSPGNFIYIGPPGTTLVELADGRADFHGFYDSDGRLTNVVGIWSGGDFVCISGSLLRSADPHLIWQDGDEIHMGQFIVEIVAIDNARDQILARRLA